MLVPSDDYREHRARLWTSLPEDWRHRGAPVAWSIANGRGQGIESFLEGPELAPDGTLYCVDIPGGRIFAISPAGEWRLVLAYNGWPNGLKHLHDGRLLIADCRHGLVEVDPVRQTWDVVLDHRYSEHFRGVNDLQVTADGAVWFTDQGQTGLHDATGRVYRWQRDSNRLDLVLDGLPSPNGLRVAHDGQCVFVAVTRDNAVWRAPLKRGVDVTKVGRFASFYGPIGPDGLHLDETDRLWVCLPGGNAIWLLNMQGEVTARVRFPLGALPTNVALDAATGRAYVTCSGAQAIFVVDPI